MQLVRCAVARNANTTPEILNQLSRDEVCGVRVAVANNPNVTIDILQKFLNDKVPKVRRAAKEALKKLRNN